MHLRDAGFQPGGRGLTQMTPSHPAISAVVALSIIAPLPSFADDGASDTRTFVHPFVVTGWLFDSNLFGTPEGRLRDTIARVAPGLIWQRASTRWTAGGRISGELERFADHAELTTMGSRQQAAFGWDHRPTRRLSLMTGVDLLRTHTPSELTGGAGLVLSRAPATRLAAFARANRQMHGNVAGTIESSVTDDASAMSLFA